MPATVKNKPISVSGNLWSPVNASPEPAVALSLRASPVFARFPKVFCWSTTGFWKQVSQSDLIYPDMLILSRDLNGREGIWNNIEGKWTKLTAADALRAMASRCVPAAVWLAHPDTDGIVLLNHRETLDDLYLCGSVLTAHTLGCVRPSVLMTELLAVSIHRISHVFPDAVCEQVEGYWCAHVSDGTVLWTQEKIYLVEMEHLTHIK